MNRINQENICTPILHLDGEGVDPDRIGNWDIFSTIKDVQSYLEYWYAEEPYMLFDAEGQLLYLTPEREYGGTIVNPTGDYDRDLCRRFAETLLDWYEPAELNEDSLDEDRHLKEIQDNPAEASIRDILLAIHEYQEAHRPPSLISRIKTWVARLAGRKASES